jgi:hypothetical protein
MHPALRTSLKAWLLLVLLSALLFALWWSFEGRHEGLSVIVDDDGWSFASGDHPLLALGGLLMAGLFFVVVVPVVLLVAVGVPALVLCGVAAIAALVLSIVLGSLLSPLVLPVLLVWWLLRRDRRPRGAAVPPASTTIAP